MRFLILLFCLCVHGHLLVFAQTPDSTETDLEPLLEAIEEDEGVQEQLLEGLTDLLAHPLDINTASIEDFARIPYLGAVLGQAIVQYRNRNGLFPSIPHLRNVAGITEDIFIKARPFLTIGQNEQAAIPIKPSPYPYVPPFKAIRKGLRYEVIQRASRRLETGLGYDPNSSRTQYLGAPYRVTTRFRAKYRRNVSIAITADQDAGEPIRWNPSQKQFGYDFVSGHIAIQNMGRIRSFVLGDFTTAFGQGLTLWRGTAFGKGGEPTKALIRRGTGVSAYGSTDESRFFRGVATTIALTPQLNLSSFVSFKRKDASEVLDSLALESQEIGTLYETGLHRTATEQAKRNTLQERVLGGALVWNATYGQLGLNGYQARFNPPIAASEEVYRFFSFEGHQAHGLGLFGHYHRGLLYAFGELGRDTNGQFGGLGGIFMRFSPKTEALFLVRHYPADFNPLYASAFGERSGETRNEAGLYWGLQTRPHPKWLLSLYFDQFKFPWLRFGVARPTIGYEAFLNATYFANRWLKGTLQFKTETKETALQVIGTHGRLLPSVTPQSRQSLRGALEYAFSRNLQLRARVEGTRFQLNENPASFGVLLYQDLRWQASSYFHLSLRYAFFDTDDYNARVYAFENDAPYALNNPAFSGMGQRFYVLAALQTFENLDFWFKFGATRYEHVQSVGSGLDEVQGNRLREASLQMRYRF